ncbi:heavy metal translocating P-type ATPase [Flavobacterium caseinilyticum]|uniref:P-type Zn(2+) transporter n=1 Tax=Flavobacterium caseinilyticum TaxID=2541732 RepID=A0A4R5B049_9FLAO|nr:heavy metal translocating P-type ATPase [Flavobacterium caseinilyticum]TDD76894.1 cadmium-translocating P-type ATPase [Flavobacterium caseinilyticum]
MAHKHKNNASHQTACCSLEENKQESDKSQTECCTIENGVDHHDDHDHDHDDLNENESVFRLFLPSIISFVFLVAALLFDNYFSQLWFNGWIRVTWYVTAYLPVGFPVLKDAVQSIRKGAVFSEFFLMSVATIGAFGIGQYAEGVTVMLFYAIGELFQMMAVQKAKSNIKSLLDQRPDTANVLHGVNVVSKKASEVTIGEIIELKPGEKLALDGKLLSEHATFNTVALTGESKPDSKSKGDIILAGMINLNAVAQIEVTTAFTDSKLSKILEMVHEATARKAPTELFIRKFAKIYTPIVVYLAIGICLIPLLFVNDYVFKEWLYRALIFLVISCPCALVISIPLGYFGGIGAASKNGILFKGSTFLDTMAAIQVVVLDKTGTLTKGVFRVQKVIAIGISEADLVNYTAAIEAKSTHPVGSAIIEFANNAKNETVVTEVTEIAGLGITGFVNGNDILVGSPKLMKKFNIEYDSELDTIPYTIIVVAINKKYSGYFLIADEIKEDAKKTIESLHKINIKTILLSGDNQAVVMTVAKELNIDEAYGNLLPENKIEKVEALLQQKLKVAFVGDGVNDAPVIALADVGIAMGGLGSDATIETADIVIQNDQPTKIFTAINIGRKTKQIVWQNIGLAFSVKLIVLILGAGGLATMWEAVFADVGVALLAILNAVRIQRMKF